MTRILNLDAVAPEQIVIVFKGKEHPLKPVTVKDFVENTKQLQEMGTSPGLEKEVDLCISMILRAFPTMNRSDIEDMALEQLQQLIALAHENNGQLKGADEIKVEEKSQGNAPTA